MSAVDTDPGEAFPLHPTIASLLTRMRAAGIPALSSGTPEQARSVVAAGRPGLGAGAQVRECRALQVPTRNERIPALLLLPEGRPAGLCVSAAVGWWGPRRITRCWPGH